MPQEASVDHFPVKVRWIELILLYVGVPGAYRLGLLPVPLFALLWVAAGLCLVILLTDAKLDRRGLWHPGRVTGIWPGILLRFALLGGLLTLAVYLTQPQRMFQLVIHRPGLWLAIMGLYPLLSVYPQSLIYRAFFEHRYRRLVPGAWPQALLAGALFSYMHVIFWNPIAISLTLVGGVMFYRTYQRSGSLLISAIEHSLYGCLIFTVGWGWYFYHLAWRAGGG